MNALLWLLLPVAAASGWWLARRLPARRDGRSIHTTPAYFRGLNYLLNEEPDKAIDVFVQLLEVDSETVETHLALGSLFRRRGEVERAIRIHQNLIARPALDEEHRASALLELGKDYMRAGLYDRAENLFLELKEMKQHVRKALENLLVIYQQEKDWQACLDVSEELQPLVREPLGLARAHYYCELAEEALARGDNREAESLLERAVVADPQSIRPRHLQARMARERGDCQNAISQLRRIAERNPDYISEILPDLHKCHAMRGDLAGLREYLENFLNDRFDIDVVLALVDLLKQMEGEGAARRFLTAQMESHPTIRGLLRLMELNATLPDASAGRILVGLKDHMGRLLAERPAYQCTHCGYAASTLHWQCPSCRHWSTLRRKHEPEEKRL